MVWEEVVDQLIDLSSPEAVVADQAMHMTVQRLGSHQYDSVFDNELSQWLSLYGCQA